MRLSIKVKAVKWRLGNANGISPIVKLIAAGGVRRRGGGGGVRRHQTSSIATSRMRVCLFLSGAHRSRRASGIFAN